MSSVHITPEIKAMYRRRTDWCPVCDHLKCSCICAEGPVNEHSSVLRFMQSPTHPAHSAAILECAAVWLMMPTKGTQYARGHGDDLAIALLDALAGTVN